MAERSAMASGLSLSENETGGGGCRTSSGGPCRYAFSPEARSVEVKRGVIGEYGGAAGVGGLSPYWPFVAG
jgi:hypothetical protein